MNFDLIHEIRESRSNMFNDLSNQIETKNQNIPSENMRKVKDYYNFGDRRMQLN